MSIFCRYSASLRHLSDFGLNGLRTLKNRNIEYWNIGERFKLGSWGGGEGGGIWLARARDCGMVFISKFIRPALSQLARKNFFAIGLPEKWGESRRVEGGGYGTRTHFPLAHPPPSTFQFLSECEKALLRGSYGNTFQAGYRFIRLVGYSFLEVCGHRSFFQKELRRYLPNTDHSLVQ